MGTLAIAGLVGTIALGIVVGLLYLQRARKKPLVTAHLVLALAATGLVAVLAATSPAAAAGPPGLLPLAILAAATAGGYFAKKVARRTRQGAELMLFGHVVLGLAGFFVFLSWVRHI
jgi:hypothetical protein